MNPLRQEMMQIATGYWLSKALYCAARADVADQLAQGPQPVSRLAEEADVDPENLHRILRALASVGIFAETDPGTFTLTDKAEYLRGDHEESIKYSALMLGDDLYEVWGDIFYAVESGRSAIERRFGRDFFAEIAKDPQKSRVFDSAMQEIHGGETALMLDAYDFSKFETVLDVGGGNGSTLCGILNAHPSIKGQLFDLPPVVDHARQVVSEAGLGDRVEFIGGNFFDAISGSADAIVMRHVLHDWSDEQSTTILRHCREALKEGGRVLIVEKVIRPGNDPEFAKLLDLNMMAIGGKERTEEQYATLLADAGFNLAEVHATPGPVDVVEATVA